MDPPATRLDRRRVRRGFARAASSFDGADLLQTEVRQRLLDRLQWVRLEPARILDLGAGTGRATAGLAERFPDAEIISLDVVPEMLAAARAAHRGSLQVCGDAGALPLPDGSVDLVFSSLVIHWCEPVDAVFAEVRRVLRFPGLFTFATVGPESFRELRQAFAAVDAAPHVMGFPDLRSLGAGLAAGGLAEVVLDADLLTITYPDLPTLTTDLRATGTTNADRDRRRGLLGRHGLARATAAYEQFRTGDGRLPATVEVLCGQAWAPDPAGPRRSRGGEVAVPLGELRRQRPDSTS
jgi:malonyl-CoA O-methyltransferase